jgi:ADP-heptose:LPS heptosyltransferase
LKNIRSFSERIFDKLPFRIRKLIYHLALIIPCVFRHKRLLIVRLDAIGDYILFRNSLKAMKQSPRFEKYSFSLLGNALWSDLAEKLDSDVIDRFNWINPAIVYNRNSYSYSKLILLVRLKFQGFQIVIHPVHSRMLDIDFFISELGIPVRIASSGDDINYQSGEKEIADALYTSLIPVHDPSVFEFLRNRQFVAGITEGASPDLKLTIPRSIPRNTELTIAISPGAGHPQRRWPAERFAELIRKLSEALPGTVFYICGSGADIQAASIIKAQTTGCHVQDFTGRISLPEFTLLLQKASLLVGNDSSSIHLAAALDVPAVCISNGNMFGRFQPYPDITGKAVSVIYPDKSFYDPESFLHLVNKTRVRSDLDIALITVDTVYNTVVAALKKSEKSL